MQRLDARSHASVQRSLVELSEGFADSAMSEMSNIDTKVRAGAAGGVRGGPGRGVGAWQLKLLAALTRQACYTSAVDKLL